MEKKKSAVLIVFNLRTIFENSAETACLYHPPQHANSMQAPLLAQLTQFKMRLCSILAVICMAITGLLATANDPLVARASLTLMQDNRIIHQIEKGDLLTLVRETGEGFTILTHDGQRGEVAKENVARLAEAVEVYDELIKAQPKEGRLYTLRASAAWARGDAKGALADFDQAILVGYKEAHAYSSRGLFYAANGNQEKAIADYNQALKLDPKDEATWVNRAAAYMTLQKPELAYADYTAAIKLNPQGASLYQQRALALKGAGKFEHAMQDLNYAISLDPKSVTALMSRGYLWFQKQEHQRAVEDFSAAIELDPRSALAFNNRGHNLQQLGRHQEALKDFDQAIRLAPEYALAHQNRAWLLATATPLSNRDGQQAVLSAMKVCELRDYKLPGDLLTLAAAFAEDKKFDEAVGWQIKGIELLPEADQGPAEAMLQRYREGRSFDQQLYDAAVKSR